MPSGVNDYDKFWVYRSTASFLESEKNNGGYVYIITTFTYNLTFSPTTYVDSGLTNNQTYYYHISILDKGDDGTGLYSIPKESFSVVEVSTCPWEPPPSAPSGFTGVALSTYSINWSWNDVANESGYRVKYSTSPFGVSASSSLPVNTVNWTEAGFSANTSYYRLVVATNTAGEGAISNADITYTLAKPPVAPIVFTNVGYSSATLQWTKDSDNPSWTRYGVIISTNPECYGATVSTAVNFSKNLTAGTITGFSLNSETTYWFRIIAFNENQVQTAYIQNSTMTKVGPPVSPSNLKIYAVLGTTSIYWQVDDNSIKETGMYISSGTNTTMRLSGNLANTLFTGTTYWAETGLSTNTAYTRYAEAINESGAVWSVSITSYTLANSPTGLSSVSVYSTSSTIQWTNVGATRYAIERSTGFVSAVNWQYIKVWADSVSGTSLTDTTILGDTTYWYRVKSYNGDGVLNSMPSNEINIVTLPGPPTGFSGVVNSTTSITWAWADNSGSELGYRVKTSTGGIIKTLSTDITSWTEVSLSPNTQYSRYVVSYNLTGESAVSNTAAKYTLANPPVSVTVTGVTNTTADLLWGANSGSLFKIERSLSEGGSGLWTATTDYYALTTFRDTGLTQNTTYLYRLWGYNGNNVISAEPSGVISTSTLFVIELFAVTPPSGYDTGAVNITNLSGSGFVSGCQPKLSKSGQTDIVGSNVVVVSSGQITCSYDLTGKATGYWDVVVTTGSVSGTLVNGFEIKKTASTTQTVDPKTEAEVTLKTETVDVKIEVPANTFSETVTVTITTTTAPVSDRVTLKIINIAIEITTDKGFQPSKEITITITYRDIDVVGFDKSKLVVGRYDETNRRWLALPSTAYPDQNKVVGRTNHLSKFAILQLVPASSLSNVKVYPNPFTPKQHPAGVIIDNLTTTADIKIYTITGELVRRVDYTTQDGKTTWDGKNTAGKDVASGVYLVFIDSPEGKKTVKIAIER